MMTDDNVYIRKPNGRYEKLGTVFAGFPADGIWYVHDGRNNLILKLADIEPNMHPDVLQILAQKDRVCERVMKLRRKEHASSIDEVVAVTLRAIAELAHEDLNKPDYPWRVNE